MARSDAARHDPPALVRLYPTGLATIDNVRAVVQDVMPERAAELLAYRPAAFTTDPPAPQPDERKEPEP